MEDNGKYAKKIYDTLVNVNARLANGILASGKVTLELLGASVTINEKSAVGYLLQEWLENWLPRNSYTCNESGLELPKAVINVRSPNNSQEFPDFYPSNSNERDLLELKTFDYTKSPNFDIANFDAYARSILENPWRLNADYLIIGYELDNGILILKDFWLKKIWEITCATPSYPLKVQAKQKVIHNIRPYNFKTMTAGNPEFSSRKDFVMAIRDTMKMPTLSSATKPDSADKWFAQACEAYFNHYRQSL